jgi:hypothetical protein
MVGQKWLVVASYKVSTHYRNASCPVQQITLI